MRSAVVGGAPAALVWTPGAVWIANGRRVLRVDPSSLTVDTSSQEKAQCEDSQMAAGLGAVWLVSGDCMNPGQIVRIDPATGRPTWHARIPAMAAGVAAWVGAHRLVVSTIAGGARWMIAVVDPVDRRVTRLAGARDGADATGSITGGLTTLVATPAGFWAEPAGYGGVARIVPRGSGVTVSVFYSDKAKAGLAYGDGIVFAGLGADVLQLDPATGDQAGPPLRPPGEITALAYGGNNVWIGTRDGRLYRHARGDHNLVLAGRLPWEPTSVVVGGGFVWAIGFRAGQLARIGSVSPS